MALLRLPLLSRPPSLWNFVVLAYTERNTFKYSLSSQPSVFVPSNLFCVMIVWSCKNKQSQEDHHDSRKLFLPANCQQQQCPFEIGNIEAKPSSPDGVDWCSEVKVLQKYVWFSQVRQSDRHRRMEISCAGKKKREKKRKEKGKGKGKKKKTWLP